MTDPHGHADLTELMIHRQRNRARVDDLPMFAAPSVAVDTSERAADSIKATIRPAHRRVLALLYQRGPLTCEEIRSAEGWSGDYARPRLVELEGLMLVEKCDGLAGRPKLTRPTLSSRHALCYRLTALGSQRAKTAA